MLSNITSQLGNLDLLSQVALEASEDDFTLTGLEPIDD